ncbi:MAG: pyrroline-5-carboxylate reductase [Eubacterium sp.]|nr:pyrroline-5-carboxylate reductase [Eubacterium sp.]
MKYGFIGVGKMGGAILRGLLDSGKIDRDDVLICGRDPEKTKRIADALGVKAVGSKQELTQASDVIMIGVEPKAFPDVMPLVAKAYQTNKVLISMAAGVTIESIESYLPDGAKVVRIMPNAPARVGEIMASVSPNKNVTKDEADMVVGLLSGMGKAVIVPEDLISAVIGVSGSSPAYTYMYIRALAEEAVKYGMDEQAALTFAAQAVLGAAKIVLTECSADQNPLSSARLDQNPHGSEHSDKEPDHSSAAKLNEMIDAICTPGGTTIEAVKTLNENRFEEIVRKGAEAAIEKSIRMSKK